MSRCFTETNHQQTYILNSNRRNYQNCKVQTQQHPTDGMSNTLKLLALRKIRKNNLEMPAVRSKIIQPSKIIFQDEGISKLVQKYNLKNRGWSNKVQIKQENNVQQQSSNIKEQMQFEPITITHQKSIMRLLYSHQRQVKEHKRKQQLQYIYIKKLNQEFNRKKSIFQRNKVSKQKQLNILHCNNIIPLSYTKNNKSLLKQISIIYKQQNSQSRQINNKEKYNNISIQDFIYDHEGKTQHQISKRVEEKLNKICKKKSGERQRAISSLL